ncbi:hypothetical protein [Desulfotruncus alcoholivorax]|uniref:hypothetical protein n=1 Tax=Desulfotruncus alcoholivorax TaxID=265477 RepID=UPI000483E4C2|nr:hypothetical protein [Desulfotruncus alcoholivorax]
MKKMCPFKGFTECLQDACMAWAGSDCRMFAASSVFTNLAGVQAPAPQPAAAAEQKNDPSAINESEEKNEKENLVAKVIVTKVELTKNGNTRAACRVENGSEDQIVIAKNGVGKALQGGLNKKFEINYNVMKDGIAWFAIKAKEL